jgi:hypothetical protein
MTARCIGIAFTVYLRTRSKGRKRKNHSRRSRGQKRERKCHHHGKQSRLVFVVVSLYLLSLGVLTGILVERIQFDESRSVLLTKLEEDTQKLHKELMAIEREGAVEDRAP